jgi:4-amino-4-deoxyprephenate dehydrogenase
VKTPVADLAPRLRQDIEVLSLNPLFAPDLDWDGQCTAAVQIRPGPRSASLVKLIADAGSRVIELDAAAHDRRAATAQAAVHATVLAYGIAVLALDGTIDLDFSTPPQRALLSLLARISSLDPDVYRHIQVDNPHAIDARRRLSKAIDEIGERAADPSGERFAELFDSLRGMLGSAGQDLAELSLAAFASQCVPVRRELPR